MSFAQEALEHACKRCNKLGSRIGTLSIDERHELRKRLKRLRYTAGFFQTSFPKQETKKYLSRLSKLQDVFGELNDLAVAESAIDDLIKRGELGPDRVQARNVDIGVGEEVECGAAHAVLIDRKPMPGSFRWRKRQLLQGPESLR